MVAVSTNAQGHPGPAVIEPVSGFAKAALDEWFARRLQPDADVYSDGLGAFHAAVDRGHAHTVNDAGGRAATEAETSR